MWWVTTVPTFDFEAFPLAWALGVTGPAKGENFLYPEAPQEYPLESRFSTAQAAADCSL